MGERSTERPIFLVGCHRSGTTLLRLMLDSHPNISCGPETLFLTEFARRITGDRHWPHYARYGFTKEYWHAQLAAMFDRIQTDYAHRRGKVRWADKSLRYTLSVGLLAQMFPTCQFVHVIRDGRDVVASHRDTWGYLAAAKATAKWPYYVRTARGAGYRLSPERYHEIRYEDLVLRTQDTISQLLAFLGEPWDDAVLRHDEQAHDVQPRYHAFSAARRAASADGGAIYRSSVGTGGQKLDPVLRTLVRLLDRRRLQELGYR